MDIYISFTDFCIYRKSWSLFLVWSQVAFGLETDTCVRWACRCSRGPHLGRRVSTGARKPSRAAIATTTPAHPVWAWHGMQSCVKVRHWNTATESLFSSSGPTLGWGCLWGGRVTFGKVTLFKLGWPLGGTWPWVVSSWQNQHFWSKGASYFSINYNKHFNFPKLEEDRYKQWFVLIKGLNIGLCILYSKTGHRAHRKWWSPPYGVCILKVA